MTIYDPAPAVSADALGWDTVIVGQPFSLQLQIQDLVSGTSLSPDTIAHLPVNVDLPAPQPASPGGNTGWVMVISDPDGNVVSTALMSGDFDPVTNTIHVQVPFGALSAAIFVPVAL